MQCSQQSFGYPCAIILQPRSARKRPLHWLLRLPGCLPPSAPRAGRDLVNMAKKRPNVIPIIEDARHPQKYRMLVPMVDVVFADVAQPDQGRIVGLNAQYFLRNGGFFVISIKASCIDSTAPPEAVFAREARYPKCQANPAYHGVCSGTWLKQVMY